jgi:2,5-diketo-D-gluconate reductase A
MQAPDIKLNDGTSIPQLGLGVYQARDGDEIKAVKHALTIGYRHIDTAAIYQNEEGVGKGVQAAGVPREQIHVTSKIWNEDIRKGRTTDALDESLGRLHMDYLDLVLLHWPAEGRVDAWRDLIEARKAGKVRAIGVSNFTAVHLQELIDETGVIPVLNQIEYHPYLTQPGITEACHKHSVAVEAWSPLMQGKFRQEPVFGELAAQYGKSEAQIILRWDLQKGVITIPKSVTPSRIEENFQVFDFSLSEDDMIRIDALERGMRCGPDPENFGF